MEPGTGDWAAHLLAAPVACEPGHPVSTIYVTLPEGVAEAEVRDAIRSMYAGEPFVYLLPAGQVATLAHTVDTNYLRHRPDRCARHAAP